MQPRVHRAAPLRDREQPRVPTGKTEAKKLRGSLGAKNRRFDRAKLAEITRKTTRN